MNPGPPRGATTTTTVEITPDMVDPASPDGQKICSLEAMVAAMGRASRALIEPHLDPGEIQVPDQATFVWRAPVPVGAEVELAVTVAQVNRQDVMSEVVVRRDGRMVARGTHSQRIVQASAFGHEVAGAG
jgi:predicted thioesterase